MFQLIKKDIMIQKKTVKFSILLMIFFTITLSNLGPGGLTIGILAITYQLVLGASALEEKNSSDIILLSLPIKKYTIVLAKYISVYVFSAYVILVYYLVYLMVSLFNIPLQIPLTLIGVIGAIIVITIVCSLSFPMIFKYGYIKSKMANLIILFIFVFGGTTLINFVSQKDKVSSNQNIFSFLYTLSNLEIWLFLMIPLVGIIVLSYFLSTTFYNKREF